MNPGGVPRAPESRATATCPGDGASGHRGLFSGPEVSAARSAGLQTCLGPATPSFRPSSVSLLEWVKTPGAAGLGRIYSEHETKVTFEGSEDRLMG